jgi:hypothetical protein
MPLLQLFASWSRLSYLFFISSRRVFDARICASCKIKLLLLQQAIATDRIGIWDLEYKHLYIYDSTIELQSHLSGNYELLIHRM